MSTPTYKGLRVTILLMALAGCGSDTGSNQSVADKAEIAANDGKVECALAGSDTFERTCSTEQFGANGATMLVIRHPDGGFRRFIVLTDGRGLAPADGFDETRIRLLADRMIELSSGDDLYRLPAQIKTSQVSGADPAEDAS